MTEPSRDPLDPTQVATLRQLAAAAGPAFLAGLVTTFAERGRQLVADLEAASDAPSVVAAAHELKGSASTIGAALVAEHARRIELAGRAGRVPNAAEVAELGVELAVAAEALRRLG